MDSVLLIQIECLLLLESGGIRQRGLEAYQSGIDLFDQLLLETIELSSHVGVLRLCGIGGICLASQHCAIFIYLSDQSRVNLFKDLTL